MKVRKQQQQKQAWYIQKVKEIRGVTENSANKVEKRERATATRFDLAQGSHQAVEHVGKRTAKAGQKKKTDSISNKELNPT